MNFLDKVAGEKREAFSFRRRSLVDALESDRVSLIAEVKRRSPSRGDIRDVDAVEAALEMEAAGASAISVLTEPTYFGGSLQDLSAVKKAVEVPVLRKEFIVDERQLTESALYGADAVLLIASILGGKTADYVVMARDLGLECLVEVHGEEDLCHALASTAKLIGVNNRDLESLGIELGTTEHLSSMIPGDRILVAESGVKSREDVERMRKAGAKAVLVGTAVMESENIAEKIRELIG